MMNVLLDKKPYRTPPASPLLELPSSSNIMNIEDDETISTTTSLESYMFLPFDDQNPQLPSPLSPTLNKSDFFIPRTTTTTSINTKDEFNFLLVDDNQINLTIMAKIINKSFPNSCNLTSTTNPLEILDILIHNGNDTQDLPHYDVLFLDIEMPELNGVQIAERLRSIHLKFDKLAIIAVTSCYSPQDLETYRQVGIDHTIPKPVSLDSMGFKKIVLEIMEKRR